MQKEYIPLSVPNFGIEEKELVKDAVESEWVSTSGEYISIFEKKVADYLKVEGAVACQSGTSAIHLSLVQAEITKEHEVIVPTLTFIASVNPIIYQGASPIFMDCDNSLNMDLDKLENYCAEECTFKDNKLINRKTKKHIKAIIIVHIFGNSCNMERLMEIAKKYSLIVIEDAAEALGSKVIEGKYKDRFLGTIGDYGIYSFNGNKIITTGGGGMVVSNKKNLNRIKYLSTQSKDNSLYYIHNEIGFNYRMTNIQAALGVAQIDKLEEFIKIKKENYFLYKDNIEKIKGLSILEFNKNIKPNYWFYALEVDSALYKYNRDELLLYLENKQVQTRPVWGLIHQQKPFLEYESYEIYLAEKKYKKILNIPCSSNLKKEDIYYIINILKRGSDLIE